MIFELAPLISPLEPTRFYPAMIPKLRSGWCPYQPREACLATPLGGQGQYHHCTQKWYAWQARHKYHVAHLIPWGLRPPNYRVLVAATGAPAKRRELICVRTPRHPPSPDTSFPTSPPFHQVICPRLPPGSPWVGGDKGEWGQVH